MNEEDQDRSNWFKKLQGGARRSAQIRSTQMSRKTSLPACLTVLLNPHHPLLPGVAPEDCK